MLLALTCVALAATAVETEARQILDQLLRVDTSHGNETAALQPVLPASSRRAFARRSSSRRRGVEI